MVNDKINITLPIELDVNLKNGKKIRIVKTKKESLFHAFDLQDSVANKISSDIADDPLLLKFLFLKSSAEPPIDDAIGTTITIPFIFNHEYDFNKYCNEREDYDRQNKKLNEILDKNKKMISEIVISFIKEFFGEIMDKPNIIRLFKSRSNASLDDFTNELSKSIKDESVKNNLESSIKTMVIHSDQIQILSKLKEYAEIVSDAQINCRAIHNDIFKIPEKKVEICTALEILTRHTVFSIESLCLDCWYKKRQLPFFSDISRMTSIKFEDICPACSDKGLVHKIQITLPYDFNGLLLGDASWAYEVFIGYLISNLDFIKNVYVHKKIQLYDNGEVKTGTEVDVIAITSDCKLILIEVTKQRDDTEIRESLEKKIRILEDYNIPYDKIIYVTASNATQYYDIKTKNARIFGMSHIHNLEKFIKEFIVEQ